MELKKSGEVYVTLEEEEGRTLRGEEREGWCSGQHNSRGRMRHRSGQCWMLAHLRIIN